MVLVADLYIPGSHVEPVDTEVSLHRDDFLEEADELNATPCGTREFPCDRK